MKPALTNRLNYLRTRLHADFGDTEAQTVWLGNGTADTGPWTKVSVLQTRTRPARKDLTGFLGIETGDVVIFVKKSDWPAVKLDDNFLIGPSAPGDITVPQADNRRYRVTAHPSSPQLDWQRIEAQAH